MSRWKSIVTLFSILLVLLSAPSCRRAEVSPQGEDFIVDESVIPSPVETPESEPFPEQAPISIPEPTPAPLPEEKPAKVSKPKSKPKSKKPKKAKKSRKAKKAQNKNIIGSFQTYLGYKDKNRRKNIKLAAKEINGYVLRPGEIFSFNEAVGERNRAKGYRKANIIMGGKYVKATGGGVCQVSTTLYNAARKSGMLILERHPHSKPVSYVRKGTDATVSYGSLDLKFKNTKKYPVKIRAKVKNKKLYINIIRMKNGSTSP